MAQPSWFVQPWISQLLPGVRHEGQAEPLEPTPAQQAIPKAGKAQRATQLPSGYVKVQTLSGVWLISSNLFPSLMGKGEKLDPSIVLEGALMS